MSTKTIHNSFVAVLLLGLACTSAAPDARFKCSECVDEMHKLGGVVRFGAKDIMDYLTANYYPPCQKTAMHYNMTSPVTTLVYSTPLSTISSWMVLLTSARPQEPVMLESNKQQYAVISW